MRRDSPPCCAWVGFSVYSHLRLVPCYTARASFNSSVSKPFTTRKKHVTLPRLRLKVEREDACFLLNEQPPLRGGTRLVRLWKREEKLPPAQRTRADQLRVALSGLGPVFVKIGQTLSPDDLAAAGKRRGLMEFLRERTYELAGPAQHARLARAGIRFQQKKPKVYR